MSPIKEFKVKYEAVNKENTFSEGDPVAGTATFTLTEDTKVKCVLVKVKGEARVHWSEGTGDRRRSHSAHRRYFKEKVYLVPPNDEGTELPKGDHHYKYSLRIPPGDMPPSFKGFHGKIVYTVTAKISRSWHLPSVEQKELNFVSKSLLIQGQANCPQTASVGKEVGVFSKEQIQMTATVDRKVCCPGETLSIAAQISNSSSKKIKPKFSLQQRIVYRAATSRKYSDLSLCKMVGDILKHSEETISCQMTIPGDVIPDIHNCDIITLEHYLKVYLDISYSVDPEVKLPLVIIPFRSASLLPDEDMGPYPAGAPGYSDFPPPAFPSGGYPLPPAGAAYGYPAPAPAPNQYGNTATQSGYNNPWPQPMAPQGYPAAVYPPPSAQNQTPTAPPLFQQDEQPPNYSSLYPPIPDTYSGTDKKAEL